MQHRSARRQFSLTSRRTAACVAVVALGGIVGATAAASGSAADEPTTTTTVSPATTTTVQPGSTTTVQPATTTTVLALLPCPDVEAWTQVDPSGGPAQVVGPDGTPEPCVISVPGPANPIVAPPTGTG